MNRDEFRSGYGGPPYTAYSYQLEFYEDSGGAFCDTSNNFCESRGGRPSNFRGRNPPRYSRPPSGPSQPYVGAPDLQNRMAPGDVHLEFFHPNRTQQQERDPPIFNKKRKFEGRIDHIAPKRKTNQKDDYGTYSPPSSSQPNSKNTHKKNTSRRGRKRFRNDFIKEVYISQTTQDEQRISENDVEVIECEDEEVQKESNEGTPNDVPITASSAFNPTPLVELSIQLPRIDVSNIIGKSADNNKGESTNEGPQSNKKITNNSLKQLKLFLLECNRKLRDNFKISCISDVKSADEITDAVFSVEKGNVRNLYQVKYFQQEYRSYKKISYRTLVSADFNLDTIYKIFKDNEGIDRIVIVSNLDLDELSLKKRNIKVIRVTDSKSRNTHHLQVNEDSDLFKRMIEKHSCIPKLAEYLDECMRSGKPVVLKGPVKECHVMLITENVINITAAAGRKQIGELHPRFINSPDHMLKPAIAQLRRQLKNLNFGNLRINEKLIVGENFGKHSSFQRSQVEKLVDDLAIEDTLKRFFEKLEFIECEKNIEYHIVQELGRNFDLIQNGNHVQAVKEELFSRLQYDKGQAGLFRTLESKIMSCSLKNYQQMKNAAGIKLEFELKMLENLKTVLINNKKPTIIIKSDYPALCALKVQQVVKSLDRYHEGQYFFLDMDDLLSAKNNLLNVFRRPLEHLLVVQADNAPLKSKEVNDCLEYIIRSITGIKSPNKIVLIQNVNNPSFHFCSDITEYKEMFNNEAGLTQNFQDKLSETQCECYGPGDINQVTTLKELILQPCDLSDLLTSAQCVDRLVKGKVIIGESLIKPTVFESTYTVPRRLKRYVVLNTAALKEESQDEFFLFGDQKESKINKVHYFKDLNSALSSFEQFTSQNKKVNAHLLKSVSIRDSNQLLWQKSSRSVSTLMKYAVENNEVTDQSETVADVLACRIMIICGRSGRGKSHYLFELAHRVQTSIQNLENWVVQLNFNDSLLEQHAQFPLNSPDDAVCLLSKILGYDELHQRLFRLSVFGKLKINVSLFVDGLEKLRESNLRRGLQILRFLRKTKLSRIYVTARPDLKEALEQTLDDFAFNLDLLTQDEQRIFLVNTWFSLASQGAMQYNWDEYVDEIFNAKKLFNIINEPLYLHVFALVFWHYMKDGEKLPLISRVYHIYAEYIDKFTTMTGTGKENFIKSFPYLSLKSLLHPSDFRKLNLPEVSSNEDFEKLNHSSFAEYGAAKWLASLPLQEQLQAFNAIEDFAERTSIVFMETLFALNCNEFYMEYIEHIGDNRLVIQLFIHYIWDNADDHQKQEYLKEAARTNRIKLVCELMLIDTVFKLPADFLKRVTVHIIWRLVDQKPNSLHRYWSLIEKLMQLVPQFTARVDSEMQLLPRLLAYFFARGRHEIVSKVLKSLNDHAKEQSILHARVDGYTPLEIVNSSALMTDEQRLAISKFLIERVDSRKNVHSVMTAAARYGHLRCLKYFAGRSSEIRTNFLSNAIKTNQLDVLRFLLNDSQWTRDYNQSKNYPLHTAVAEGVSFKTLDFLLRYGGINNRNSNGETALSVAIKAGVDLRIIEFLVEKEADVNVKDKTGLRPWCYSVLQKWTRYSPEQQLELMRFLKKKNCKPKLPYPDDFQLTYWLKELERKLEYLWDPENYDFNGQGATPRLHGALREKDLVWFKFLLQHGADPDALGSRRSTALHLAVTLENDQDVLDAVRLLLRHGATYNAVDAHDNTPYDLLRHSENATDKKGEACRLLRQARDLFSEHRCTDLLRRELSIKDSAAVQSTSLYWLLHCRDARGRTLLHRAAERDLPAPDLERLLLFNERHGNGDQLQRASWLEVRDRNCDTAVRVAVRLGRHRLLRELARRGASLQPPRGPRAAPGDPATREFLGLAAELFSAARAGSLGGLQAVARGQQAYLGRARDDSGRALLHLAAATGRGPVTRLLLRDWRANPDALDQEGRTPLHHALLAGDLESAKMLLKAGASLDARDRRGRRPADLGSPDCPAVQLVNGLREMLERCWRARLGAAEAIAEVDSLARRFELEASAVVNARDRSRNSMAHYAARNHEPELLRALLCLGAVYDARNAAKETPTDLAVGEVKDLLAAVDELFQWRGLPSWEAGREALGLDAMIRCRKAGGYTLLHAALEAKKIEEAKWLLDRGADVNVTNHAGAPARKLAESLQLIVV